jgi:endonuclease YncB( thermonuclease family)
LCPASSAIVNDEISQMRHCGLIRLFPLPVQSQATETSVGKVVSIADDDTLTVLVDRQQVGVRPEVIDAREEGEPFGAKATTALGRWCSARMLLFGRPEGTDYAESWAECHLCSSRHVRPEAKL